MAQYFTTANSPTGNRWLEEYCGTPTNSKRKMVISSVPLSRVRWMVGSPTTGFLVSTETGQVYRIDPQDGSTNEVSQVEWTPPSRPLVAVVDELKEDEATLQPLVHPSDASRFSSGVILPDQSLLYISDSQQLLRVDENKVPMVQPELSVITRPLVDGAIVSNSNNLYALYSHATTQRYVHGALGDAQEGVVLQILAYNSTTNNLSVQQYVDLSNVDDAVFEGLSPFWADVDDDGVMDIVTTISKSNQGAQVVAFLMHADGTLRGRAETPFIGAHNRWRHVLGAGRSELVEVVTPHIGGRLQYHALDSTNTTSPRSFVSTAASVYYTSHTLNSRNLDQSVVVDLNQDGVPEVMVQDQAKTKLVGIQRDSNNGLVEVWSHSFMDGEALVSNLAVACDASHSPVLGFATPTQVTLLRFSPSSSSSSSSPSSVFGFYLCCAIMAWRLWIRP